MSRTKLTLENFLKSMEGEGVKELKYGDTGELIWRLARTLDKELDELYQYIEDLKAEIGL